MNDFVQAIIAEWAQFAYWKYLFLTTIVLVVISLTASFASYGVARFGERQMRSFGYQLALAVWLVMVCIHIMLFDGMPTLQVFLTTLTPAIAVAIILVTFDQMVRATKRTVDWSLKTAKRVQIVALEKFHVFDRNKDGLLSSNDIITSMASGPIPKIDQVTLQYMLDHLPRMGHIVATEDRIVPMPIPGMRIGVVPTKMKVRIYAISRKDIEGWPDAVKVGYKRWIATE